MTIENTGTINATTANPAINTMMNQNSNQVFSFPNLGIPSGSQIYGVQVQIAFSDHVVSDHAKIYCYFTAGSNSATENYQCVGSETGHAFGSSVDLWGLSPTYAQMNGATVTVYFNTPSGDDQVQFSALSIQVWFERKGFFFVL